MALCGRVPGARVNGPPFEQQADHGRVDAGGRLVSADPRLAALHARAGGEPGGVLAVPQLRGLARLARRLAIPIARPAIAADGEQDVELWVRARLDGEEVELAIAGWRPIPVHAPEHDDARTQDFLRAEGDFIWECDAGLRLTQLSPRGAALLGGISNPVGEPLGRLFRLVEDEVGELPLLIALSEREPFADQQAVARGSGRAFVLAGLPLRAPDGGFTGFRGAAVAAESAAVDNSDDAGAFARRLDRALRDPLDRIIAHAESIRGEIEGPVSPDYASYAGDIASAGRHLLGLVGDLVDLEAIERPDFRPPVEPFDLADAARRAAGLLAVRAADKRISIERPPEGENLPALGDFGRVLQILVNLIGNAVRFSDEGTSVRVSARCVDGKAQVRVADEGPGIARKDQERVFEKFERLGAQQPGSGLGLYIARRLARAMGGDVTLDSKRGKGARFTLSLPAG